MSRTLLITVVTALLVVSAAGPTAATFHEDSPEIVEYEIDGELKPSYSVVLDADDPDAATSLQDWANASHDRRLISLDNSSKTATVAAPADEVALSWMQERISALAGNELETRSYIESVEPNYRVDLVEPVDRIQNESEISPQTIGVTRYNDPDYPLEGVASRDDASTTSMADVRNITSVDNVSGNASGFTGAVVDTGANYADGSVFQDRIRNDSKNFITGETVNESGMSAIADGNGHGTWTAAAIAGNASGTKHDGMAPNADLLVLKALDDDGQGSSADIAAAIRYAADKDADVISLSLGSVQYTQSIADAVDYANSQGSVVVAAAGNSRWTRSPGIASPADVENVVTVGASNGSSPETAWSAEFSQTGPDPSTTDGAGLESQGAQIDVVAPGMKTTVAVPTAAGGVTNQSLSGTSMSTPEVAGGILRAMAANQTLADAESSEVVAAVQNSATPAPNMAVAEAGHGMFNAENLANGTHPSQSQEDAMTDAASQRNTWYETASEAAGGWLSKIPGV